MQAETRVIAFDTQEFTDSHVDVSPDGSTLVFDLLGDIYTVPIAGGDATPLTMGSAWDIRPRYSPDGQRIAFISDRSGDGVNLWSINADGDNTTVYDVVRAGWASGLVPAWTPDGDLLDLIPGELASSFTLHRLPSPQQSMPFRPFGNEINPAIYRGSFTADGNYAYHGGSSLQRVDLRSGESGDLGVTPENGILNPRVDHQGRFIAYILNSYVTGKGERCALHLLDQSIGRSRKLIELPGCSWSDYAFVPDGAAIVLNHAGRLVRLDTETGDRSVIPVRVNVKREAKMPLRQTIRKLVDSGEIRAKVIRWPTVSSSLLTFGAFAKIYVADSLNERPRRLTKDTAFEFSPALSPDGKWIAYTNLSDTESGHVMIAPVSGGTPRQLTVRAGRYVNPVWSRDGTKLAFISDETDAMLGLHPRIVGAVTGKWPLTLKWVSIENDGEVHSVTTVSPITVDSSRFHPVPSFSEDGNRIFVATYTLSGVYGRLGPVLLSVSLDGRDVIPRLHLPAADEVVVSPDGHYVAIIWQGRLYVTPLPRKSSGNDVPDIDLDAAHLITYYMPTHVSWQDENTLIWASANDIYQYRLGNGDANRLVELSVHRPRAEPDGCYALVNAKLITMRDREVIERGSVLVCRSRIVDAGPVSAVSIPEDAHTVDASDTVIIPGLFDVHAHSHHPPNEAWLHQNIGYIGNLAHGVTTLYDPSAPTLDALGQAEMVDVGEVVGPRIYSAGSPIMGGHIGRTQSRVIQSLDDARVVVDSYTRYGAGPLKDYATQRRDVRQWLAIAARERGVALTSHSDPGVPGVLTRIIDGFTSLEHDINLYRFGTGLVYSDVLQLLAASEVNYTHDSLSALFSSEVDIEDPKLQRLNPKANLQQEVAKFSSPKARRVNLPAREQAARTLAHLVDLGGLISIGAHGNGVPGLATHLELWALVLFGKMDPLDALRAATLNGAKKLNLDADLGSIEAGKVADLIVLNSNPLENIRNSTDIRYVIKGGFVYDAESMTQVWPTRKELKPWPWQSEEERKRFAAPEAPPFPPE